ncbi:DUF7691 family protein [Nocardia tengchongensis]|uniref:DUF7691 family protein n=1 Tax=Nocardia tengchongensis TaxID=2055889 RepID=UPI0036557F73
MSRILHVYLVDLAELEAVVGSKDDGLLNQVLAGGRLSVTFQISDQEGHIERNKDALRTIFAGGPFDEDRAEHYVEALELICRQLGPYVGDVNFRFGNGSLPSVIEDLATGMMGKAPFPMTEWNGWGFMSKKACAKEVRQWERRVAKDPDYLNGYGEPIADWLRESKTAKKDLIGFWGG